ncbi:hypothetical protein, partial [Corynebacterium casei]|uniref:hypothetical protein n=1 Tax=Corynebacterium casei TaxID=160386 RepID=UPI00264768CF
AFKDGVLAAAGTNYKYAHVNYLNFSQPWVPQREPNFATACPYSVSFNYQASENSTTHSE